MTCQAKTIQTMLGIAALIYGGYFVAIASAVWRTPVDQIAYQPSMIAVIIARVLLAIAAYIATAITTSREERIVDERDNYNALRGERVGGFVLGVGTFAGLSLVMFGGQSFWIAHILLCGLALAEMTSATATLVLYRRGG